MRTTIFSAIILLFFGMISIHSGYALSQSIAGPENYPGKLDTKNLSGLGKNIGNDFFGGAMTFTYPFTFPEGSRGMTPNIELSYSSNNSDASSMYGYGFSLSIPRIQRSTKKGVSDIYLGDEYSAFGDDLVRENGTSDRYRSKNGSDQNLYTRSGSSWIVTTREGKTLIFGESSGSRIYDPNNQDKIFAWYLSEEWDQFGNKIVYSYLSDAGQLYISDIFYGFDQATNRSLYTIHFDYITKKSSLSSHKTQFEISTRKMLMRVSLIVDGKNIRGYDFAYDTVENPISHLISIGESAGEETLPVMEFSYGQAQYQHLITGIDNHRGGRAEFEYTPSSFYRTDTGAIANPELPFIVTTLSQKTFTDSVTGISSEESYSYENGHYFYDQKDVSLREYVGFGKVTIVDGKLRKILFFHQSQNSLKSPLKHDDHIAKKGRSYQVQVFDKNTGRMLKNEITRYDMKLVGNERRLVSPTFTLASLFDEDGSHTDTAMQYQYDNYGNILEEKHLGFVKGDLENGTYTDIPGDTSRVVRTFALNTERNLSGFLRGEAIFGYSGEILSESRIEYDNAYSGVTRGLMTAKIQIDTLSGGEIRFSKIYSNSGMLLQEKDPLGNTTSYSYDTRNISLVSTMNPLSWEMRYEYDYNIGKMRKVKNYNSVTYTTLYDPWGRELKTLVNTGSQDILLSENEYIDQDIPNSFIKKIYFDDMGTDKKTSRIYLDGGGRTISRIDSTQREGQFTRSHIRYDENSNPIYISYPTFTQSDVFDSSIDLSGETDGELYRKILPGTVYQYDALDRIISQRDARGITKKSYTPETEKVIDVLGHITIGKKNARGSLIEFREKLSDRDIVTRYQYDALDRMISLTDTLGNTRSWSYNGIGKLAQASDLHSPSDTDYGVRSYQYDILGRLVFYINPNGEKVQYRYDALSRIADELMNTVSFRKFMYDSAVESRGMLAGVSDSGSTVAYGYDTLGRKISEIRTIQEKIYTLKYNYNNQNTLTSITYPDGGMARYKYEGGYLKNIDYADSHGNMSPIVTDISFSPQSTLGSLRYGNGIQKTIERDPQYNYRLTGSRSLGMSGEVLLDTQYFYDPIGNIGEIRESGIDPLKKNIDYSYDTLNRLIGANYLYEVDSPLRSRTKDVRYTYDDIGNILYSSVVGDYSYAGLGYTNPHAVTKAGSQSYFYDQAGNLTSRIGIQDNFGFTYTPYGEMLSSAKNSQISQYFYDHTRRRISKNSPSLQEHHVIDGYEVEYESGVLDIASSSGVNSNSITGSGEISFTGNLHSTYDTILITKLTHIMLGDERVATFQSQSDDFSGMSSNSLIYHLSDHLNSSSLDISSTGIILQARDYLPFGKQNTYDVTNIRVKGKKGGYTNKYQFANKQLDDETDLQYFEKRYYDNTIGRFTSQDPVFWEIGLTDRPLSYLTAPQNWNTYSYTINNPINLVDPMGEKIQYNQKNIDSLTKNEYYSASNFSLQDGDNHYLANIKTAIQVSFNEIDSSTIRPDDFDAINKQIIRGVEGVYYFSDKDNIKESFTTTNPEDYTIYGDLTYKAQGKLTIDKDGKWDFDGTLKAYDDTYDFTVSKTDQASMQRWGRNIQTIGLRELKYKNKGTPFQIQIRGEKRFTGKGQVNPTEKTQNGSTIPNRDALNQKKNYEK